MKIANAELLAGWGVNSLLAPPLSFNPSPDTAGSPAVDCPLPFGAELSVEEIPVLRDW
ncbi:MAG: hypothetical protein V3U24_09850 [Candidatus Neomarinimicrobiota bacterium]